MSSQHTRSAPSLHWVIAAFATVYIVWGSTYLAIRFAVETLPPFLMSGVRFLIAGVLLFAFTARRQAIRPTRANWRAAAVVGCLMLVGGPGLVGWAEQYVPSGLAALMICTVPLWMVLLDWLMHRGPRPTPRIVTGLVAGLLGVAILIGPSQMGGERVHLLGGTALLCACVFWSLGSLRSRQANLPSSPFVSTAMQMICAGAALLLLGTLTGEWWRVDVGAVSVKSVLSVAYLAVFGSILALSAYTWLLRVSTPARVATYAYVNPVVAMALGYVLANEPMTPRVILAAAVILTAVAMITTAPQRGESVGATRDEGEDATRCQAVTAATATLTTEVVRPISDADAVHRSIPGTEVEKSLATREACCGTGS